MTSKEEISYYEFEKIKRDELGCYWGYVGDKFCEVFVLSEGETEQELKEQGYAKCDAPGTETFLVADLDAKELLLG